MMEGWMRTGEAAALLGISRTAVNRLIARGTLKARYAGGLSWIPLAELRRLASDGEFRARTRNVNTALLNKLAGQMEFDNE